MPRYLPVWAASRDFLRFAKIDHTEANTRRERCSSRFYLSSWRLIAMTDILSQLNGGEFLGLCGIMLGLIAISAASRWPSPRSVSRLLPQDPAGRDGSHAQDGNDPARHVGGRASRRCWKRKMGASKPASLQEYWADPWLRVLPSRLRLASAGATGTDEQTMVATHAMNAWRMGRHYRRLCHCWAGVLIFGWSPSSPTISAGSSSTTWTPRSRWK